MALRPRRASKSRPVGKLGRLSGVIPVGLHEMPHYVAGSLPAAPPEVKVPDVKSYLKIDWGMLGNNEVGNCGVAGLEHGFMADAVCCQEELVPADDPPGEASVGVIGGPDPGRGNLPPSTDLPDARAPDWRPTLPSVLEHQARPSVEAHPQPVQHR